MPGKLFVVATPIGNLADITLRAVETLRSVDVIACEDTRRTEKLLRHLGFQKPLVRYDEHTHAFSSQKILDLVRSGKSVALVTDAGTPSISDPGSRLVDRLLNEGLPVVSIPGASSVMAALSISGFKADGFTFLGFLPRRPGRAKRELQQAFGLGKTIVVFESPHRTLATLQMINSVSGHAQVAVVRELTKIHEEIIRGGTADVIPKIQDRPEKGEVVILINPKSFEFTDESTIE